MRSSKRTPKIVRALLTLLAVAPAVQAFPKDPDNAALFYYQAFISIPKGLDQERDMIDNLPDGADPNDWIRQYLDQCRPAITLAVAASEIPACDWGLRYSRGFDMQMPHLAQMRPLAKLMKAEVAVLAADKKYRQALERCLTIRRMSQHVGDENLISWLVSIAINAQAEKAIQNALSAMPPNAQTLEWFQAELAAPQARQVQIQNALGPEEEVTQFKLRAGKDTLLEALVSNGGDLSSDLAAQIKKGDSAFFEGSSRYLRAHMEAVRAVFDSPAPYAQRLAQLRNLDERPALDAKQNPQALVTAAFIPDTMAKLLTLDTRAKSNGNLLRAALSIYLVKARTGAPPDQIPAGAPKDAFNGQDFKYEKTQGGFTLTRWTDDAAKDKTYQFAFKVR